MSTTEPAANAPPATHGHGRLGVWDTIAIIVGIVIGTGIFVFPGLVFVNVGSPWMGLLIWVAGGVMALVGALCYAELATTYPRSGGDYVYLTMAFGPWAGFLFGWAQLMLVLTASIGIMAWVFAQSAVTLGFPDLAGLTGLQVGSEFLYAVLVVVVLSFVNILGVTFGKTTQNILTIAKVLGLGAILVAGFGWAQPDLWEPAQATAPANPWHFGTLAIILVLLTYGGWNDAAFVAGEIRDPQRNISRALILGVSAITLIYLLVNAAYLLGLGFDEARRMGDNVARVPERLLDRAFGEQGSQAMSIIIMLSALGAVNGLIFTGARIYATLGADYRLFSWLGHWKPGRRAPAVSLLLQMLIVIGLLALLGTREGAAALDDFMSHFGVAATGRVGFDAIDAMVAHTAPVFWFFFLLTGLSVFVLRQKDPHLRRPFSVPFYPVLPLLFCSMCMFMLYSSLNYVEGVHGPGRGLLAFGVLWVGVFVYLVTQMFGTSIPSDEAMHFDVMEREVEE